MKKQSTDRRLYYNIVETLSHNCVWHFINSARGMGKTYTITRFLVQQFIKHGYQFIFVRKQKSELERAAAKFFDDIVEKNEFPSRKFSVKGENLLMDKEIIGYTIPLSLAHQYKGNAYPRVAFIFFDEYVAERTSGRILHNEVELLISLYETVARMRENVRVLCCANVVTMTNKYYAYFKMFPKSNSVYTRGGPNRQLLIHNYVNAKYSALKKSTTFGELISGTREGDHILDNVHKDNPQFIAKPTGKGKLFTTFAFGGNDVGVWLYDDGRTDYLLCNSNIPDGKIRFAFDFLSHSPTTTYLSRLRKTPVIDALRGYLECGKIKFSNANVQATVLEVLGIIA